MKIASIIQARMGSSRMPGKVMKKIDGIPMIELLIKRLSKSKMIDQIIVATSEKKGNSPLINHIESLNLICEIGDEDDVLKRYFNAAKNNEVDIVVRITGDCPLIDSDLVDKCVATFLDKKVSYLSNIDPCTYPDGLDIEVFSFEALKMSYELATSEYDREHVTPYIRNSDEFAKFIGHLKSLKAKNLNV